MFFFIYRDTIDYVYESHKPKAIYNYLHALSDYVTKHTEFYIEERQTEEEAWSEITLRHPSKMDLHSTMACMLLKRT